MILNPLIRVLIKFFFCYGNILDALTDSSTFCFGYRCSTWFCSPCTVLWYLLDMMQRYTVLWRSSCLCFLKETSVSWAGMNNMMPCDNDLLPLEDW